MKTNKMISDIYCIYFATEKELNEFIDIFGIDNICSPFYNKNTSQQEQVHQMMLHGYNKCIFDKERLDCLQMIPKVKKIDNIPLIDFTNFPYKSIQDIKIEQNLSLINRVEDLNNSTPNGYIIDADTMLADFVQSTDFEISGIAQDIINIWKNSTDKKSVEDMFYMFTDISFEGYLKYCIEEMSNQKEILGKQNISNKNNEVEENIEL